MEHTETLIQRYLEGKTSVAEEQELRMFFQSADVPQELKKYASLFTWQDNGDDMGADLDDIFAQSVSELESEPIVKRPLMGRRIWWAVAACIAVVASATLFLNHEDNDTIANRPIAQRSVEKTNHTDAPVAPTDKTKPMMEATKAQSPAGVVEKVVSTAPISHTPETAVPCEDTYSDPQVAYEEAQKALMLLSDNLNKGFEAIENANISNS